MVNIVYILYIDLVKKNGMERKSDYKKWKINNPRPEFLKLCSTKP